MIIRKLNDLTQKYPNLKGNYYEVTAVYINMKKEREIFNKSQEKMKNTMSELKNMVEGIKSRLDEAEDRINELEDKIQKNDRNSWKRFRRTKMAA